MRHSVMALILMTLSACGNQVSNRPCPRVSEFPELYQLRAADELATLPRGAVLPDMMDAMAADRAWNRAVCR